VVLAKKKILEESENYARGTSGEVFAQASTLATSPFSFKF